jgi:hypothetical protein
MGRLSCLYGMSRKMRMSTTIGKPIEITVGTDPDLSAEVTDIYDVL